MNILDKLTPAERAKLDAWSRSYEQFKPTYEAMMEAVKSYKPHARINIYRCKSCDHSMVTRDSDLGVTPFMTGCQMCKDWMQSSFYRVPQIGIKPTHEWYRPNREEFEALKPASKDHCARGGLLLRAIGEAGQ